MPRSSDANVPAVWRGPPIEPVSALDHSSVETDGSGAVRWVDPLALPVGEVQYYEMTPEQQVRYFGRQSGWFDVGTQ